MTDVPWKSEGCSPISVDCHWRLDWEGLESSFKLKFVTLSLKDSCISFNVNWPEPSNIVHADSCYSVGTGQLQDAVSDMTLDDKVSMTCQLAFVCFEWRIRRTQPKICLHIADMSSNHSFIHSWYITYELWILFIVTVQDTRLSGYHGRSTTRSCEILLFVGLILGSRRTSGLESGLNKD